MCIRLKKAEKNVLDVLRVVLAEKTEAVNTNMMNKNLVLYKGEKENG